MKKINKPVEQIINELLTIDPELKPHREEIRRVVEAMLKIKPDTQFDHQFAESLRRQLLRQMDQSPQSMPNKWIFGLSGVAVALAIVLAVVNTQTSGSLMMNRTGNFFQPQVVSVAKHAFGNLGAVADQASAPMSPTISARPQGGGGGPAYGMGGGGYAGANYVTNESAPASEPATDAKMIAPYPALFYKFVYKGEELKLDQTQGDVYKRLKGGASASDALSSLRGINLGLANIGSFDNLKLLNFQLIEDKPNGLALTVDLNEETLQIYQNWMKWNYDYEPTQGELPSDAELIAVAKRFVSDHGLDVSSYGEPFVDHRSEQVYPMADTKPASMPIYRPTDVNVRYPLLINGQPVYEQYGDDYGLWVNVNVKAMAVSSVSNLTSQRYEKSAYDLETDTKHILKIAENGGNPWYYQPEDGKVVEIALDTPKVVYMRSWQYDGNTSTELYVPALYFPVKDKPAEAMYIQNGVLVPLAKDILAQYDQQGNDGGVPTPRPLMMESTPGAAAPTTTVTAPEPTKK